MRDASFSATTPDEPTRTRRLKTLQAPQPSVPTAQAFATQQRHIPGARCNYGRHNNNNKRTPGTVSPINLFNQAKTLASHLSELDVAGKMCTPSGFAGTCLGGAR